MIRRLLAALNNRRTARLAALDTWMATPAPVPPDDLTALADVLAFDPPTTRPYAVPDTALVVVGKRKVHPGCRDDRRDGRTVRNCCAPLLARSATEVQW